MSDEPRACVCMLRCADGSCYASSARRGLDQRIGEHNPGTCGGYTSTRRPVVLVWAQHFLVITDAHRSRVAGQRLVAGDSAWLECFTWFAEACDRLQADQPAVKLDS